MAENQPIIKKVKKVQGEGHHGGAWKVAYADFVTGMMAFFLMMWIVNMSSEEKLEGIAKYFTPQVNVGDAQQSTGQETVGSEGSNSEGKEASDKKDTAYGTLMGKQKEQSKSDEEKFKRTINEINKAFKKNKKLKKFSQNIKMNVTPEGLRIQLIGTSERPIFKDGSAELYPYVQEMIVNIAGNIATLPNYVSISGHTRADPDNPDKDDWILSAKRAYVVRERFANGLIAKEKLIRIIGKSDNEPLLISRPEHIKNSRVSITLLRNSIVNYTKRAVPSNVYEENESWNLMK